MRNLKRVLSLALALVMVLGMMVIGTSAATFTDAEEITYKEAVDVMAALGVINGFEAADGTFYFDGDKTLTREQGAAFVCYMLMGKTAADKLVGSGNFTDVAANRWSAGAIDYCANLGLVKGNPDGTFNPTGPLTSIAFGRMLLGALGYDGDIEGYVGSNWASCIAADMLEVGLVVKNVALDAQLTREQAAQMAFQALTKTLVKYETKGTTITVNGMNIVSGASSAEPQTYVEAYGYDYTTGAEDALAGATIQFCEKYFSNLSLSSTGAAGKDNFGRPGHTWTYGTAPTAKLFVVDTPVLTYNTAVTGGKVYTDLGKVSVSSMVRIVNGYNTGDVYARIVSGNTDVMGGNGTTIEIYKNSTGNYTAVAVQTFIGEIKDHTEAVKNADGEIVTKEKVQVEAESMTKWFDTTAFSAADEPVAATSKPGTAVLVTATYDGTDYTVRSVEAVAPVTVTVSSVTAGVSFIADGKTYKFSENYVGTVEYSALPTATNKYNLWLDKYGYVIDAAAVGGAAATTGYALVTAAAISSSNWTDGTAAYEAKLIMADGTAQTVATDAASYAYIYNSGSPITALVKYTINAYGQYVFSGGSTSQVAVADADDAFALNKGVSAVVFGSSDTKYANTKTIFFVGTTNAAGVTSYKVVTGIANMDSIVDKDATEAAYLATSTVLNAVVITDAQAVVNANEVKNVSFVQYNANAATTTDASGSYKVYNAVINGAITTVKVDDTFAGTLGGNVLASSLTYGQKGLVEAASTSFTGVASSIVAEEIETDAKDGIVTVATSGTVSYADNCVVYVVKATGITAGTTADLKDGATMSAVLTNGVITAAFVIPAV